jgi:hypothetical protein
MRTFFISLTIALVVGSLCFVAGGYFTGARVIRDTNYAQLLWLTSIDRELHAGNPERARKISLSASDMTLNLLERMDRERLPLLMTALGGFNMDELNDQIATRAKLHFLPISEGMSDESKRFLEAIIEVDIPPSTCPTKPKDKS